MEYNGDFKYDLKVSQLKEKALGDIFEGSTIELKHDLKASSTGNVYVEYESRGKPSGISTSQAEFYCFCINESYLLIPATVLKEKCRKYWNTSRDKNGGDSNTSKGILLPIKELF
jgi:hypothetical protein